jgi:hypothetical protein
MREQDFKPVAAAECQKSGADLFAAAHRRRSVLTAATYRRTFCAGLAKRPMSASFCHDYADNALFLTRARLSAAGMVA